MLIETFRFRNLLLLPKFERHNCYVFAALTITCLANSKLRLGVHTLIHTIKRHVQYCETIEKSFKISLWHASDRTTNGLST